MEDLLQINGWQNQSKSYRKDTFEVSLDGTGLETPQCKRGFPDVTKADFTHWSVL